MSKNTLFGKWINLKSLVDLEYMERSRMYNKNGPGLSSRMKRLDFLGSVGIERSEVKEFRPKNGQL